MKALWIALAPLALTACDVDVRDPSGAEEKVGIKGDGEGRVSFDMPFAKGEVKLPASMMKNADFDIDGVKMIPGGSVTGFNVDAKDGNSTVDLDFAAPKSPAEVQRYFLDAFKAEGIEAAATGQGLRGRTDKGDDFEMRFAADGAGTKGTISIQAR